MVADSPVSGSESPVVTDSPVSGSEPPVVTDSPVSGVESPVVTDSPVAGSESPVVTDSPVSGAESPAVTDSPVSGSESPAVTDSPVAGAEAQAVIDIPVAESKTTRVVTGVPIVGSPSGQRTAHVISPPLDKTGSLRSWNDVDVSAQEAVAKLPDGRAGRDATPAVGVAASDTPITGMTGDEVLDAAVAPAPTATDTMPVAAAAEAPIAGMIGDEVSDAAAAPAGTPADGVVDQPVAVADPTPTVTDTVPVAETAEAPIAGMIGDEVLDVAAAPAGTPADGVVDQPAAVADPTPTVYRYRAGCGSRGSADYRDDR